MIRRITHLEKQCPGNPGNMLRRWLETLRSQLEMQLPALKPHTNPSHTRPRFHTVGSCA
jgi:hypothetical protein